MSYTTTIKAGQVNNLTNARFFASYQVDWIGFDMDPLSTHTLNPDAAQEIMNWLVLDNLMGEFANRSVEEILHLAQLLNLRGAQVPYEVPTAALKRAHLTVIKTLALDMPVLPMALDTNHIDFLLVEPGKQEWSALDAHTQRTVQDWTEDVPVLLSVPPEQGVVEALLAQYEPAGINLLIPDEIRPGVQEFEPVLDLLEALSDTN